MQTETTKRPVLYVAHPLRPTEAEIASANGGASRELATYTATINNARRALAWRNWLRTTFADVTFIAPWVGDVLAGDDDSDPAQRERGIRDNCALILKLDGVVLCGPRISDGMRAEVDAHRQRMDMPRCSAGALGVYDLTSIGATPPAVKVSNLAFHVTVGDTRWTDGSVMPFKMWAQWVAANAAEPDALGLYGDELYPEAG